MFGFCRIEELTHHLETIYEFVRNGQFTVNPELFALTLETVDNLRVLLQDEDLEDPENKATHTDLVNRIQEFAHTLEETIQLKDKAANAIHRETLTQLTECSDTIPALKKFEILFKPSREIMLNGTNPLYLIDELYGLGDCAVTSFTEELPELASFDPKLCYTYWNIILETQKDIDDIKDIFIFVEDECTLDIKCLNESTVTTAPEQAIEQEEQAVPETTPLQAHSSTLAKKVKSLKEGKSSTAKAGTATVKDSSLQSIRVSSEKLDDLMNLVSELVTTQARLSLIAEQNDAPELLGIAENIEKISRRLRDNTFSICLVPIENMMIRFQRLVRDLSTELNKEITFVTEGTETELDKSIMESLMEPLMHIFRNSIDHGIEQAAERIAKGKPAQGKILLKAFYSGTNVLIQIIDDGAGINADKVKAKAISKGLIAPDAQLTEKEIIELVFMPGFSTADKLTEVSGRGVGMDVVKRKIADIRGDVDIESVQEKGTTITIRLPLTLSIIDGLLVKIDNTHYVIPLSVVDKCYETKHSQLVSTFNNVITLDEAQIPFYYLRKEFGYTSEAPEIQQMVVINYNNKQVGLSVDAIIGEYQAVLKPLGKLYKDQEIISGATILGDGTIALLMDTHKIVKQFSNQNKKTSTYYE